MEYRRPSDMLHKDTVKQMLAVLEKYDISDACVFGAVARSEDDPDDDIFLFTQSTGLNFHKRWNLENELEEILDSAFKIHVSQECWIKHECKREILEEMIPLYSYKAKAKPAELLPIKPEIHQMETHEFMDALTPELALEINTIVEDNGCSNPRVHHFVADKTEAFDYLVLIVKVEQEDDGKRYYAHYLSKINQEVGDLFYTEERFLSVLAMPENRLKPDTQEEYLAKAFKLMQLVH